jgi:hypothetical protein
VFCNQCFAFHWHGSDGIKVPHCLFSARWYYITLVPELPDAYGYRTPAGSWRVRCSQGHWHRSRVLGHIDRPHDMEVRPAPVPGTPVWCHRTGRFFDLRTGDEVLDPGFDDRDRARFGFFLPATA